MYKRILLIVSLLAPGIVFAQTDSVKRSGSVSLTGASISPGVGSKVVVVQAGVSNYLKYKNTDYTLDGTYLSARAVTKTSPEKVNDGSLILQPRLLFNDWNIFAFSQVSKAYTRNLNFRYESAIGGGKFIYKSTPFSIATSYAVLYDYSNYSEEIPGTSVDTKSWYRHSARVKVLGKIDRVSYFAEFYYQPELNKLSSYNYRYKLEAKSYITKKLSMNILYNNSYETVVVNGNHTVSNLTFGLSIDY